MEKSWQAGVRVDFCAGPAAHRLRSGAGRGGALARAVGRVDGLRLVDATAGLGRDAFVLASLGHAVTLIERAGPIHDALAAAIVRGLEQGAPDVAAALERMTLLAGDARELLPGLAPDVVTIDPMHPPRAGSALTRAPMRLLRATVGSDEDAAALISVALGCAARRVVLKWPLRAPLPPGVRRPSHSIAGRTVRFDVFVRPA